MDKTVKWAIEELAAHGFQVDESHAKKVRVTHPNSDDVGWLKTTSGSERHARNFVRQMFRRHGVLTEEDRAKRNGQAVKERRAQEAAAEAEKVAAAKAAAERAVKEMTYAERARTWHADHGVKDLAMTKHAASRALDMAFTQEDLLETFYEPEKVYYTRKYEAWCLTRGKCTLSVQVNDGTATVLTVLFATEKQWRQDFRTYGEYDNRTLRDGPPDE